jgi:DNA-binding NtrC family response regulator
MPRTLVVDDDLDIRDFVTLLLQRAGHDVSAASDGAEALDLLSRDLFDLVVLDHHMPRVTGAEVIAHLTESVPGTRVVLMSANHDVRTLAAVVDSDAVFLPKPFDRRTLMSIVESLLTTEA